MASPKLCSAENCGKKHYARGLCQTHYSRLYAAGMPLPPKTHLRGTCSVPGCGKPHLARGLCSAHVTRLRRHGTIADPGKTAKGVPLQWLRDHSAHQGDDCLAWPFARGIKGDGVVTFRGRQTSTNYAMCCIAHGEPPTPKHEAAHSCGRGHEACVNPRHLRWATRKENHADKLLHGTHGRGEQSNFAKLRIAQVREIRRLRGHVGQKELAGRFGVTRGAIHLIQVRKNWRWLP